MQRLKHLAVNDEGFVFDPHTGDSYLLNQTGLVILRGLQADCNEAEISFDLTERFYVPEETARRDVSEFLTHLKKMRLV